MVPFHQPLSNVLNDTFSEFIQQFASTNAIYGSDYGISCGLIDQYTWETHNRYYIIDLSRSSVADQISPRDLLVTFTNNTLQTLDVMAFTVYNKELVIDVETGLVEGTVF